MLYAATDVPDAPSTKEVRRFFFQVPVVGFAAPVPPFFQSHREFDAIIAEGWR